MSLTSPLYDAPECFSASGSADVIELVMALERQGDGPDADVFAVASSFDASFDALGMSVRLTPESALSLYHALGAVLEQD